MKERKNKVKNTVTFKAKFKGKKYKLSLPTPYLTVNKAVIKRRKENSRWIIDEMY